ncbi:MAG: hypothetical protein AB7N61_16260 [Acidimicrobiia bacterium]
MPHVSVMHDLQSRRVYPSVTLLHTTTAGPTMDPEDVTVLVHLAEFAHWRLSGEVADEVRDALVARLAELIASAAHEPATAAIAVCASPDHSAVVRLGGPVRSRCIIDETFATRDMVADANRSARYRVLTASDRMIRLLIGDRDCLVEVRDDQWPLRREDGQSLERWARTASAAIRRRFDADGDQNLPTVVAGVERTVRAVVGADLATVVASVPGNHDRTGWVDLHGATWPLIEAWLAADRDAAFARLSAARGARRYAGGLGEVWELAQDGRVDLLVVEEDFRVAGRIAEGRLVEVTDPAALGVIDDVVDELIEAVIATRGAVVVVPDGDLTEHGRVAAVLRY